MSISGFGILEIVGSTANASQIVKLSGENSYSGGTVLTQGYLAGNVSPVSKLIFADNAETKQFLLTESDGATGADREVAGLSFVTTTNANLNTATVNLGTNILTINNYEDNVYAGLFSGAGAIVKTGSGSQTFSSASTISQAIELQKGRLISDGTNGGSIAGTVSISGQASLGTVNTGSFSTVNVVRGGNLVATNNQVTVSNLNFQDGSALTVASRLNNQGQALIRPLQLTSGASVGIQAGAALYLDLSATPAYKPTSTM